MLRSVCLAFAVLLATLIPANAAKRALVIGNNTYSELPDLRKAIADADAYDSVLTGLGYKVTLETDLSTTAMQRVIGDFIDGIAPGDEVAFVFAGHGWSDGSTNYIIGSDTPSQTSVSTLKRSAVPLRNGTNGVIDDMQSQGARLVLAVVDACRNNPFQSKLGRSGSVGLSRGLTLVAPVSGTFTVFSAGAGQEALDRLDENDDHPNSVFSRVFLKELSEGGSLQDIVLDTAPQVAELADGIGHVQRPAYYDGIGQRYCLTDGCKQRQVVMSDATPAVQNTPATPTTEPAQTLTAPAAPMPAQKPEIVASPTTLPDPFTVTPIELQPVQEVATLANPANPAPIVLAPVSREAATTPALIDPNTDPYFRPDPVPQPPVQAARAVQPNQPIGTPVQFIGRIASPVRSVKDIGGFTICSVERAPEQPTIRRFFESRRYGHHNKKYRNLRKAIQAFERSRCDALAVPPRLVNRVIGMVRDPSRWVVLPEVVR